MIFSIKIYRGRAPFFKTQPIFACLKQKYDDFRRKIVTVSISVLNRPSETASLKSRPFNEKAPLFARLFAIV